VNRDNKEGKIVNPILSSGLLAASMLLGQTGEPTTGGGKIVVPSPPTMQPTQPAQPTQRTLLGWLNREERPILHKIQGWFKRDQPEAKPGPFVPTRGGVNRETDAPPQLKPTPGSNDFPRKLPNPSSQIKAPSEPIAKEAPAVPPEVQQASLQQTAAPKAATSPILPQNASKVGRDGKFEWITGQVELENGNFVMYYATPETVDKYNGRIVLAPQKADMTQFRSGDLVSIRGQLVQRPTPQGIMPIYRVSHASLIERPKL
jgi:uncharacterized cupin superfamily protein